MSAVIADLYALQQILRKGDSASAEQKARISVLRAKVPEPILAHFDRSIQRGRTGVALVRHGVCCECHIRVPAGNVHMLRHPTDIILCDSCSSYLMLDPDEEAEVVAAPAPELTLAAKPAVRRGRKKKAVVAAVA